MAATGAGEWQALLTGCREAPGIQQLLPRPPWQSGGKLEVRHGRSGIIRSRVPRCPSGKAPSGGARGTLTCYATLSIPTLIMCVRDYLLSLPPELSCEELGHCNTIFLTFYFSSWFSSTQIIKNVNLLTNNNLLFSWRFYPKLPTAG